MGLVGGIDAGGTSWRCAIGDKERPNVIIARTAFPTTSPPETIARAVDFFRAQAAAGHVIEKLGIACFGPVCVNPAHADWGHILATPKAGWAHVNVAGDIARALACGIVIDTDVTAAAFAERAWGAGQGLDDIAYVTIGTGIGAGIIVNSRPIWGVMHPEAGHMYAPRHRDDLAFEGVCRFHGDCIEGLASAPALRARWGVDSADLPDDHPAWDIQAHYMAHLAVNLVLTTAVARVIFGGGVCARPGLIARVREKAKALIGPYGTAAPGGAGFEVVEAGLGLDSGLLGALWLAHN